MDNVNEEIEPDAINENEEIEPINENEEVEIINEESATTRLGGKPEKDSKPEKESKQENNENNENNENDDTVNKAIYGFLMLIVLLLVGITMWWLIIGDSSENENLGKCDFNLADLPTVDGFERCNDISGVPINLWYDEEKDRVVSENPIMWQKTCSLWCENLTLPYTCDDETEEYKACVSELKPTTCDAPALPVARNGNNLVYVYRRGQAQCY